MKALSSVASIAALLLLTYGCRFREKAVGRNEAAFPVVNEGSASGVTSTIAVPGESPSLVTTQTTPLTGTNLDTTTSFTLPVGTMPDPNVSPNSAGTFPVAPLPGAPPASPSRRRTDAAAKREAAERRAREREERAIAAESLPSPPERTDTASMADTEPPPERTDTQPSEQTETAPARDEPPTEPTSTQPPT